MNKIITCNQHSDQLKVDQLKIITCNQHSDQLKIDHYVDYM